VELSQRCCWAGGSAEWGIYRGSRAGREAEKDCGWAAAAQERSLEPRNRSELRRTDQDLGRGSLETDSYSLEARNGSLCRGNRSRARVQSECLNSDSIGSHTPSFNICSDMAPGPPRPMTITIFLGTTMLVLANSPAGRKAATIRSPRGEKRTKHARGASLDVIRNFWLY